MTEPNTAVESVKILFWGESIGFWIQTAAYIVTAIGAVAVIYWNNRTAKKRATVDFVMSQHQDQVLADARKTVRSLATNGGYAKYLENHDSPEYRAIFKLLNTYEFVACGIREKALDEGIFKRMRYSEVLKDWDRLAGFISETRAQNQRDTLYQEFEWLAHRWKSKPLKSDH